MNTFSLKVIASDKVFFDGKCGIIIVPALDGEQAIMSHHEDMVIATKEGEVRFKEKEDDDWTKVVVGVGFVYISHNRVIMLVDTAERPEDIDRVRAEAALERAKEQLRQKQSIHEYYHSKAALARSTCSRRSFSARRVSNSCFSSSFIYYSSVSMVSSALRRSSSSASFTHGSCSRMVRLDSRGERDSSVPASAV